MDADIQVERGSTSAYNATATDQFKAMTNSATSFLELPAEIRNMIYHYLFPGGRSAAQLLKRDAGKGYIQMSDRLNVLTTCRQVYDETTRFLHFQQRYVVIKPKTLRQLLQNLQREEWDDDQELSRNQIIDYITPWEGIDFDYDLDNQSLVRDAPELMYTDRWLRRMCTKNPAGARITAKMSTTSTKSAFQDFQTLQTWIRDGHARQASWNEPIDFQTKIVLAFDIGAHTEPEDVRFDATAFLRAIRSFLRLYVVQVEVRVCGRLGRRSKAANDVQMKVLLFMWHLMLTHPKTRTGPCPVIWVDGLCLPREAEFIDRTGEVRIIHDQWTSGYESKETLTDKALVVAETLIDIQSPDYIDPEDGEELLEPMKCDNGSLLWVAFNLAHDVYDEYQKNSW